MQISQNALRRTAGAVGVEAEAREKTEGADRSWSCWKRLSARGQWAQRSALKLPGRSVTRAGQWAGLVFATSTNVLYM